MSRQQRPRRLMISSRAGYLRGSSRGRSMLISPSRSDQLSIRLVTMKTIFLDRQKARRERSQDCSSGRIQPMTGHQRCQDQRCIRERLLSTILIVRRHRKFRSQDSLLCQSTELEMWWRSRCSALSLRVTTTHSKVLSMERPSRII